MSAEAACLVRTWKVGSRYTVTMTVPKPQPGRAVQVSIEWSEQPRGLKPAEIDEYRRGRDAAIRSLGLPALVIEL